MVLGLAAVALGAAGVADSVGRAKSARDAAGRQNKYIRRASDRLEQAETILEESQPESRFYMDRMLGDAEATRSRVLRYADEGLRAEIDRVMRSRDQAKARSTQDMIGRGLFSSTAATSAQRGIDADASRIAGDVGAQFASQRAGLDLAASGNVQNAMSQVANFIRAQTQDRVANKNAQANLWAGAPVVATPSPLSTAGQALGSATNAYIGYQQYNQNRDMLEAIRGLGGAPAGSTG